MEIIIEVCWSQLHPVNSVWKASTIDWFREKMVTQFPSKYCVRYPQCVVKYSKSNPTEHEDLLRIHETRTYSVSRPDRQRTKLNHFISFRRMTHRNIDALLLISMFSPRDILVISLYDVYMFDRSRVWVCVLSSSVLCSLTITFGSAVFLILNIIQIWTNFSFSWTSLSMIWYSTFAWRWATEQSKRHNLDTQCTDERCAFIFLWQLPSQKRFNVWTGQGNEQLSVAFWIQTKWIISSQMKCYAHKYRFETIGFPKTINTSDAHSMANQYILQTRENINFRMMLMSRQTCANLIEYSSRRNGHFNIFQHHPDQFKSNCGILPVF